MTDRQLAFHWYLWGEVRAGLIEDQRMTPKAADAFRKVLYRKAGQPGVSMSRFREVTNPQFDKIKGVFLAYIAPADLLAQMEQEEQPERRKLLAEQYAAKLFAEIGGVMRPGEEFADVIDRYIVRRIFGNEAGWRTLTDQDTAIIVGILNRRKRALDRKAENGVPF